MKKLITEQETIRRNIEQTPGVAEAGYSQNWWPGYPGFSTRIEIQSKPTLTDAQAAFADISPQLLRVLRMPLLRGRVFDSSEVQRQAHFALVNQAFVKQYLRDVDPIGQSVRIPILKLSDSYRLPSAKALDDWVEVIGVVGDATNDDLDHPRVRPAVFLPNTFAAVRGGVLYLRASGNTETAIRSAKLRLRELNPDLVINYAQTLQWELDTYGWGRERLVAWIFVLYAGVALVLTAAGLYSVVSFAVTQRTQELGVRMALGAGRGAIVQLVIGSTAAMLGIGIVTGLILSAILRPFVAAWGGGSFFAPSNLLGTSFILVIVAAMACAFPAWRAASLDPMQALRYE